MQLTPTPFLLTDSLLKVAIEEETHLSWQVSKMNKVPVLDKKEVKKTPKFSKNLETINSSFLTSSDEALLMRRADSWGLYTSF